MKSNPYIKQAALAMLVLCYCTASQVLAITPFYFHPLHLDQSPQTDYVIASVRDKDGFLWLGTDNGVKRYDGFNLRKMTLGPTEQDVTQSRSIFDLIAHSNGQLWVASSSLFLYDGELESFTQYKVTDYLNILALEESPDGKLWLGGDGFGLKLFNPNTLQVEQTHFVGQPEGIINEIEVTSDNNLWVSSEAGLYFFDTVNQIVKHFSLPLKSVLKSGSISGIDIDHRGRAWVSTYEGLYVITPETERIKVYGTRISSAERSIDSEQNTAAISVGPLTTNQLSSVHIDAQNRIWVATDKRGIHLYKPDTDNFYHISPSTAEGSIPVTGISDIYEDYKGSLWFSAGLFGVFRLNRDLEKFNRYQHNNELEHSLSFNSILNIHEDNQGHIWMATDGGGVNVFTPDTGLFKHYLHSSNKPNSISTNSTVAIEQTPNGDIWVGAWEGGLNKINLETGAIAHYQYDSSAPTHKTLANNNIFGIENTGDGRLILSVWDKGIQIFDPKTESFEHFPFTVNAIGRDDGRYATPSVKSVNAIIPHSDGVFWLAGYNGIDKFYLHDKAFEPITKIQTTIFDVHQDKQNTLWIASSSGLIRYHPAIDEVEYFTQKDGLSDDFVLSIEEDQYGMLWIATRNGLNKFDVERRTFEVFKASDGLSGNQFNRFSHLTSRNGLMYFGTTEGMTVFDPKNMPRDEHAPKLYFLDLELYQKTVSPGTTPWLSMPLNSTHTLTLPYSQRDIAFTFTALDFINVSKNKFRYRLKGLETQWAETSSDIRRVRYTNLEPGQYAFQLLSANSDGVWNGTAKEIKLIISPAWWQTLWAKALYGVMLLVFVYGYGQWKQKSHRKTQILLQQKVDEQTAQIKDANLSIVQANNELEQRVAQRTEALSLEIDERRESEAQATYIAHHDPLTGLKNRTWILKRLNEHIENHILDNLALFFIGGDHFRKVNDTHGHLTGDKLLCDAAKRIKSLLPTHYTLVRLGSDEFAILIDSYQSKAELETLAQSISNQFVALFTIGPIQINFGVSIGVVCSNTQYTEPTQLLRDANIAMQYVKSKGRGSYQFFDEQMLETTKANAALESDLEKALINQQLSAVYQPIVSIDGSRLNGFEMLMRWNHPKHGFVPPDKFIPIAESTGLIYEMGIWIFRQACIQLKAWEQELGTQNLPNLSVNLSALQLNQKDLLQTLDALIEETGANIKNIKLEITESTLMENVETIDQILEGLRERGIDLAIDDFGTGYSSLGYLDRLPVQFLKIDRSFIDSLFSEDKKHENAHKIVKATISLAHDLNMQVVSEGIETEEQLKILNEYQCDLGQGYFIAKPLSKDDAHQFLLKHIDKQ